MKKPIHYVYFILLVVSCAVVSTSFWISETSWNAIVMSIGCGGIASVLVAWLIDWRTCCYRNAENKKKFEIILRQYAKIYRRLVWIAVNECHGLYHDNEKRSLEEWLTILSDKKRYVDIPTKQSSMQRRCERLSGNVIAIQKFIEDFQAQSANFILNDLPDIQNILTFFEIQHVHAWGTLKQLEDGNYKVFSETTYILYKEFLEQFPQYKSEFPEKYNRNLLNEWKI